MRGTWWLHSTCSAGSGRRRMTDAFSRLKAALSSRYTIERELRRGVKRENARGAIMQSQTCIVTHRLSIWAASAGIATMLACESDLPLPDPEQHHAEIQAWHAQRIEELKQADSWISLVGHFWLEAGESSFGSDSSNAIVFPAFAPSRIGTFARIDDRLTMRVERGIPVTHEGRVIDYLDLFSDGSKEPPTARLGSLHWGVSEGVDRLGVWLKDSANPAIAEFNGIETFPISIEWVIPARFERHDPPKMIGVPSAAGGVVQLPCPGTVVFDVDGEALRLDALEVEDELFIAFGDRTNADETYGGGRHLWIPLPDETDRMFIDFNRAVNPACAFTEFAICPLPPRQNQLPVRIEAGEKTYKKMRH